LPSSPLDLAAGAEPVGLDLEVVAAENAAVGSHGVTIVCTDAAGASWSLSLDLQISQRRGVDLVPMLGSGQGEAQLDDPEDTFPGSPVVGGRVPVNASVTVVNTGAAAATFLLSTEALADGGLNGLSVAFDSSVVTLEAGASSTVAFSLDHVDTSLVDGHRWQFRLVASLSTDGTVQDAIAMTAVYRTQQVGLQISLTSDQVETGGTVSGTLVLTSRVHDRLSLTSTGAVCILPQAMDVIGTTEALPWSCEVPSSAQAGDFSIAINVNSAVAGSTSNPSTSTTLNVTVRSGWTADQPLSIVVEDTSLVLDVDGSTHTVVRVTNTANGPVTGTMSLAGRNLAYVQYSWVDMQSNTRSASFSLEAGETVRFQLELVSMKSTSGSATPEVLAIYALDGVQRTDSGGEVEVEIVGTPLAPSGMDLGVFTLSNKDSLLLLASGWVLSILLVGLLRISRRSKVTSTPEVEQQQEEDVEEDLPELGHNEARMGDGGRVVCPNCDSALGVPSGSVAPFRFTCPRCASGIRVVE